MYFIVKLEDLRVFMINIKELFYFFNNRVIVFENEILSFILWVGEL